MLSLRIALRYLFSKKSHKAVNVISIVSMGGVAVATAAIVVVLSVFNGFSDLAMRNLSAFDPDLKVVPAQGKVFAHADSLAAGLGELAGVEAAAPMLTERALLTGNGAQMAVQLQGLDYQGATEVTSVESLIIDGLYTQQLPAPWDLPCVQLAVGVALQTNLRPDPGVTAQIYIPRREGRINPANPAAAYRREEVAVSGVFRVNQAEYDADFVILPLDTLRSMLDYTRQEASAIGIAVSPGVAEEKVQRMVEDALGADFKVLTRMAQQHETFRMISVEKWVTFLMLAFILIIAAFNIISTLSLLVIEKSADMTTLRALGARPSKLRAIFVWQGFLITFIGGIIGAILGVALSLAQEHLGLIRLNADPSALTTDVYPVHLLASDVAIVIATIAAIGLLIGLTSRCFRIKA